MAWAIEVGTYPVSNIKTAEAVKVVENSQRDINIAFMNELAMVFDRMGIDTNEVVDGMNTKWNALGFRPGLVGGHCTLPMPIEEKTDEMPKVTLFSIRISVVFFFMRIAGE